MTDTVYSCAECFSPVSATDAALTPACPTCGKLWRRVGGRLQPTGPVDLPGLRQRAGEAAQSGDVELLQKVALEDVPMLLGLIGDLARSTAALNGTCSCKPIKVSGRRVGPCPHYRANAALRRIGVEAEHMESIRQKIDRRVP